MANYPARSDFRDLTRPPTSNRTVFGVAKSGPDPVSGQVLVYLVNEVVPNAVTGLNPPMTTLPSNIIATDLYNPDPTKQAQLKRVPRPDGSEFVVGTCDQNGHTSVLPRASRDTSAQHVFNVHSYGARGDGTTDDTAAIQSILDTAPSGSKVYFPPGRYRLTAPLFVRTSGLHLAGAHGDEQTGGNLCAYLSAVDFTGPCLNISQNFHNPIYTTNGNLT